MPPKPSVRPPAAAAPSQGTVRGWIRCKPYISLGFLAAAVVLLVLAVTWGHSSPAAQAGPPPASPAVHYRAFTAVKEGNTKALSALVSAHSLNASFTDNHGDTLFHILVKSWHHSMERNPFSDFTSYREALALLLAHRLVDLRVVCPLVDALHYRNSEVVSSLIRAVTGLSAEQLLSLTGEQLDSIRLPAGYPGLDAASLRDCLLEQDIFGQNVLHITAKSKAAGIARLFIRQRRSSMSNVAVKNTLRLLRLGSMEDDGPLQFTALNHATDNFDQRVMLALGRLIAGSQLEGHPFDFLDWVNTPDVLGVTPLHLAAQNYRSDALTALLDAGGNASTVSSQWRMSTAHMCAVASDRFCWEAITQTDPIACQRLDAFNRTPVDIARIIGSRASFVIDGCKDSVTDSPNSASPLPKARHLIGDITPNSARKGWKPLSQQWLMSAGIYVDRIISEGLPIPEFSANEFNADVFAMHAASLRLPVVVRGALNIPSAAFTRDALLSVIDKHACSYATAPYASLYGIEAKRSTYEEYIREWLPSGDSSAAESDVVAQPSPPPYIFDSSLLFAKAEVMSGMSFPAFTESRYNYTTLRQFAMGPALSGAPPHFHPSAWNGVAVGAKLWLLSPPLQSTFQGDKPVYEWFQLCSHVSCWRNAYVAVQGEGDMVYVPDNWEHTVLNLADTIAVAFEAFA